MIFNMAAGRNENTAKKKSKNTPKRFWKGADKNIRTGNKKTGIGLVGGFFSIFVVRVEIMICLPPRYCPLITLALVRSSFCDISFTEESIQLFC